MEHIFQPNVFNHRKVENLRIDREKLLADLLKMENNCSIQDLLIQFNAHAFSPFPKDKILLAGDKNPVYSVYTKRLLKIFPEARFIGIVRDYRDNYVSLRNLKEVKLEAPVLTLQITRWKLITRLFITCQKKFPDRFRIVRYEDLVTQPRETFRDLCGFLNIPYCETVFRFHERKDEILEMFANPAIEKIHKSLLNPVNVSRMNLWKTSLTENEVRTADLMAGTTADAMGYARTNNGFSLLVWFRSLPMALYGRLLFALMTGATRLPYSFSRRIALSLPLLVKFYSLVMKGGKSKNH